MPRIAVSTSLRSMSALMLRSSRLQPQVFRIVGCLDPDLRLADLAEGLDLDLTARDQFDRQIAVADRLAHSVAEIAAGGDADHLAVDHHRLAAIERQILVEQ